MATLKFSSQWQQQQDGVLRSGESVRIEYDIDRLNCCRSQRYGQDAWSITANVRFYPDESVQTVAIIKGGAEVAVPAGATRLEVWFHNTDQTGCSAWDSRYGSNYAFDVARA